MHLRPRRPGRLPDGKRLLGALLPRARNPGTQLDVAMTKSYANKGYLSIVSWPLAVKCHHLVNV